MSIKYRCGAHRTLSAPSKYSIKFGSVNKSNPFFLIIDDLVVARDPLVDGETRKHNWGPWVSLCG